MINITEKSSCCGCTACFNICPKNAVAMTSDSEGFLYPRVDTASCIDCGLCEKVCPIIHTPKAPERNTQGCIIRYRDPRIVENSTSGGAFTAFADYLLKKGYLIFGAGYDSDMRVVCKPADTAEKLSEMRGSKFVQSELDTVFSDIKKRLKIGEKVLFTGTPCQVAGLVSFLGEKPDNLICIDFVCRGVASPGLWRNYLDMMEGRYRAKVVFARFKNKTYGYHAATMKVDFDNGKTYYASGRVDPMLKSFVSELASRPSCHDCAFKTVERVSDITMFDCYQFTPLTKMPDDDKGYTCLMIHSQTGRELLDSVHANIDLYDADLDSMIELNGIMVKNSAKPHRRRERFYQLAETQPIDEVIRQVAPVSAKDRMIENSKNVLFQTGLIRLARKLKKKDTVETR